MNTDVFRGRQRCYAGVYAADVKGFYLEDSIKRSINIIEQTVNIYCLFNTAKADISIVCPNKPCALQAYRSIRTCR